MALQFTRRMLGYMVPLTLAPSLVLLLLAGPVAHICFGHNGTGSIFVLRWIALLPVLIALSNILGLQTMIPFGLDKQFSRILVSAGGLNVLMAIMLVRLFGAEGAGVSVFITELLVTLGMVVSLDRHGLSVFRSEQAA